MNSVPDTALHTAGDQGETARQEQKTEVDAELVELGRVSDTRGGWIGAKMDTGFGFQAY